MSRETRINDFATRVAQEINTVRSEITTYDDTAIQAEVDLNTAKVSFPEAPADGSQYARKDNGWEVVAGGGGSSPLTTKGDLYTYDTEDTRLPVGNNGELLMADSAEATGLKWTAINPFDVAKRSSTSTQSVTSTSTAIPLQTEVIAGTGISYDAGNNTRLTVDADGVYWVGGYITIESTAQRPQAIVEIRVNGATVGYNRASGYIRNSGVSWDYWVLEFANTPLVLSANDYIEFFVAQVATNVYTPSGSSSISLVGDKSEVWVAKADGVAGATGPAGQDGADGQDGAGENNTIDSITTGEPSGSDVVLNVVSLTQAEYDAGTPNSTTFYIITDA